MGKPTGWILAVLMAWVVQLLYTLLPFDLIPDILPLIGGLDDLFGWLVVLAFTGYAAVQVWYVLERRGAALPRVDEPALQYEPIDTVDLVRM